MTKTRTLIFILTYTLAQSALAQCATGVNAGGGACIPPDAPSMPNYDQSTSPSRTTKQAAWLDQWGAIVFGIDQTAEGSVTGAASKNQAIESATKICHAKGAKECHLEIVYVNQCAAVAWGDTSSSTTRAPDTGTAKILAMKDCNKSTSNCRIVYTACSLPVRIQ